MSTKPAQKCAGCGKTAYPLESISAQDKLWHKGCFKCQTCNIKLALTTYKGTKEGAIFCEKCVPKPTATPGMDMTQENQRNAPKVKEYNPLSGNEKPTVTLDSMSISNAANVPKVDTVNQQVFRVEGKPTSTLDDMSLQNKLNAPKVDTVNQQVFRVEGKPNVTLDSIHISTKMNAPKIDTVNQQIREQENAPSVTLDSMHISTKMNVPKIDTVNQQIREQESAPSVTLDSMHISTKLNAPKVDTVNQQVRGDGENKPTVTVDSMHIAHGLNAPKKGVERANVVYEGGTERGGEAEVSAPQEETSAN